MNEIDATGRIFNFALALVGHLKGGLGHVNVVASMIFSGMSGSAAADTGGLGAIEMKAMLKEGYDRDFSAAITASSATIGPVIPPSIIMVAYGGIAEVSVGKMFLGGVIPGIIMGISLMIMIYIRAKRGKIICPSRERASTSELLRSFREAFLALFAVIIVLGSIMYGIATPTEAGVLAVVYALALGAIWRKLGLRSLWGAFRDAFLASCTVSFIIAAASLVGWVIAVTQISNHLFNLIFLITHNKILILLFINIILLIWGCLMDPLPILLIAAPILIPIAEAIGMDLVHFGVMMVLNLMIGLITPPVGITLYVISDLTGISIERVSKAAVPFIIPLAAALLLITFYPPLVTFVPNHLLK
jgi:tripartite ATP-independent transporter DctM subunit